MMVRTEFGDALPVVAEDVLRRAAADRFAHRAFGDLPQRMSSGSATLNR